jgi:hypothetical protein
LIDQYLYLLPPLVYTRTDRSGFEPLVAHGQAGIGLRLCDRMIEAIRVSGLLMAGVLSLDSSTGLKYTSTTGTMNIFTYTV